MKTSNLICPLMKDLCIREKCVCFSIRDYDVIGWDCEPYAVCEHLNVNLDYEAKGGAE